MELVPSISALIKEGPSIILGHSEKIAVDEPGSGHSPVTDSAGILTLDFTASHTVRNKCLLFISKKKTSIYICINTQICVGRGDFCICIVSCYFEYLKQLPQQLVSDCCG